MKVVKVCTCNICKSCKRRIRNRNLKRRIRRYLNRQRRKGKDGKVRNWYWA